MSKEKDPNDWDLFDWGDSQNEHLERVRSRIGWAVLEFCEMDKYFHAQDLRDFVFARLNVAPASPDRILRDLRQRGLLNYEVIDRRASYYHVLPIGPPDPESKTSLEI